MSSLEADLLLFIDALGQYEVAEEEDGIDEKVYVKSDNCLGIEIFWKKQFNNSTHSIGLLIYLVAINDFYRYLRKNEENKTIIHKYLSEWAVVCNFLSVFSS